MEQHAACEWVRVCPVSSLEESVPLQVEANGKEYLVLQVHGEVHGLPALCPHMDEPLADALCDGFYLTCLKHLWQWDVRTGEVAGCGEAPLEKVPLKVADGEVYLKSE